MPVPRSKTSASISQIVGGPADLPAALLPTRRDVVRCFDLNFSEKKVVLGGKNPSVKDVALEVALRVKELWLKASVPTIDLYNMRDRIVLEHKKVQTLNKSFKRDKETKRGQEKIADLMLELDMLFDACPCKCVDFSHCPCSVTVPLIEREFLVDQRGPRRMRIGGVDLDTTRRLKKRIERKATEENQMNKMKELQGETIATSRCCTPPQVDAPESDEPSSDGDGDFPLPRTVLKKTAQCRLRLEQFARTCDKVGVSDAAASHLASALFSDFDKSRSEEEKVGIICDRKKLNREREKVRETLRQEQLNPGRQLCGLYFGRNDHTKVLIPDADGKKHQRSQKEHHISLIAEPDSSYLGHVTPTEKGAGGIAGAMQTFLSESEVCPSNLRCLGSDGENTNTGHQNGVIRLMELYLGHAVHWVVCQLHSNELPLRHLIESVGGRTTCPTGFGGPIGARVLDCETRPISNFKRIVAELPDIDLSNVRLSRDVLYLYRISKAVATGQCPQDLAALKPGKLHHARWLTKASRILREYVTQKQPSKNLIMLATFILRVYVSMWFHIRLHSRITDGPRNLWLTIVRVRYMEAKYKRIVHEVIQNNAYSPRRATNHETPDQRRADRTRQGRRGDLERHCRLPPHAMPHSSGRTVCQRGLHRIGTRV